jgi:hypothetical protein
MTSRPDAESRFDQKTAAQLVLIFEQRPELMKIALNELSYILKPRQRPRKQEPSELTHPDARTAP